MRSVRSSYELHGARGFYEKFGSSYRNPHEAELQRLLTLLLPHRSGKALDLACGSGEATLVLRAAGWDVVGADPFTGKAYKERTGYQAEPLSFEIVARDGLGGRRFDLIVCSFAMHLIAPSCLPRLVWQLAEASPALIVLTPHKRPHLRPEWGFALVAELKLEGVRGRRYARD